MIFKLSEEELQLFNNWKKTLPDIPVENLDVFGKDYQFTFKFHITGLGVSKIVERVYDGKQINLTDYDNW